MSPRYTHTYVLLLTEMENKKKIKNGLAVYNKISY